LADVPEFAAAGGEASLSADERRLLGVVRDAQQIAYDDVRTLKQAVLRAAFDRFDREHPDGETPRAKALAAFEARESDWLEDYTLFRALRDRFDAKPWWEWPDDLSARRPSALTVARRSLQRELRYHAWLQWLADEQWQRART